MSEIQNESEFVERRNSPQNSPAPATSVSLRPADRSIAPVHQPLEVIESETGASLQRFLDLLKKQRWKIGAFVAVVLAATAIITRQLQPLYESSVKIKVERRSSGAFIGQQAIYPTEAVDIDQIMLTQVELLKSDASLRPATEKYNLLELESQFKGLTPDEAARLRQAPIVLKRLKISRLPNTYILKVSYSAPDPQMAADVTNLIAKSYIQHAFDAKDRSYDRVSEAVKHQMDDLQAKTVSSNEALSQFAKQLNVVDPEQRISILSARLLQLNTDYTNAQSERLRKEAILNATKSGSLASALIANQGDTLENIIERLNLARQNFAVVRTTYGENHAEYKKAANQLNELEAQFKELKANTMERVEADYKQALAREEMAKGLVAETKQEVDRLSGQSLDYMQLKTEADNYKKLGADLDRVTREDSINRTYQDAVIQIADPARASAKNVFPSMPLNLGIAFILATMLGIGGVVLLDTLDTRLMDADETAKRLNVDVIATLPKLNKWTPGEDGKTKAVVGKTPTTQRTRMLMQYEEAIRSLRTSIDLTEAGRNPKSLLVTSTSPGEGKSTTAANLAFSYALLGKKVLIIDADVRRPSLHSFFEKKGEVGLAEVLNGTLPWRDTLVKVAREQLFLMPAGTMSERSTDQVGSRMETLLAEVYSEFDLVIIDGPPLLGVAETSQLASLADGVVLVVRAGSTYSKQVFSAYSALARARANIVGLVMNDVKNGGGLPSHYQTPRQVESKAS